jgi:hypothetical protein
MREAPAPIGFFRSETREDPGPTDEDLDLLRRSFAVDGVFLLIRPLDIGESRARLYPLRAGQIADAAKEEFPFGRKYGHEPAPAKSPALAGRVLRDRRAILRNAATVAGLAAVALGSYWAGQLSRRETAQPPVITVAPSPPAAPGIGLAVEMIEGRARVTWNPDAAVVGSAAEGTLIIVDGTQRLSLPLTRRQLLTGSIFHDPVSSDILFELQLGGEGAVSETSRLVLGPAARQGESADRQAHAPLTAAEIQAQIVAMLKSWTAALLGGDVDAYVAHYAPSVQWYFTMADVPRAKVDDEVRRMLRRYGAMRVYEVEPLEVQATGPDQARAIIRKRWRSAGPRVFAGEEEERLDLVRQNDRWLIAGERETRVAWTRR